MAPEEDSAERGYTLERAQNHHPRVAEHTVVEELISLRRRNMILFGRFGDDKGRAREPSSLAQAR
jgi:hypothetical protein